MELTLNITDSQCQFLKDKGNECFKAKDFDKAIEHYSGAIFYKKTDPILYSNRAICYLNLNKYYETIEDCDKAIELDPSFVKPYYRRATAFMKLSRFEAALRDFEKVLNLDSTSIQAKKECDKIRKLLEEDTRVDICNIEKPAKYRSQNPVRVFELKNQVSGTRSYTN